MTDIACPTCHSVMVLANGHAYCPRCGWNRTAVEKLLERTIRSLRLVFAVCFALAAAVSWRDAGWMPLIVYLFFSTLLYRRIYLTTRKHLAFLQAGHAASESDIASVSDVASPAENDEYAALLALPRPRCVVLTTDGRLVAWGVFAFPSMLLFIFGLRFLPQWIASDSFSDFLRASRGSVAVLTIVLALAIILPARRLRHRNLLVNGEIAMARISRRWPSAGKWGGAKIEYEFRDRQDISYRRLGSDYTNSWYEGMSVPVFFDPDEPSNCIAACSSVYEVLEP